MRINNETPFSVATMLWEDLDGQMKLTVIVKATFAIERGEVAVADEQLPIFTTDEHYGDDLTASVRFESDLAPFKPRADVVLVGRAYAPRREPVKGLDVTLRVGTLEKTIRVFGNRKWWFPTKTTLVPIISSAEPFPAMSIIYERAYGGIDKVSAMFCRENLMGMGFIGSRSIEAIDGKPLPNLEDPRNLISSWDSRPTPVGFGFYGRGWMPRLRYAGTYDEEYQKERAPALPTDFSYAIFNGAHPELQLRGYLCGDEDVELTNLSRKPHLHFRLPGLIPKITVAKWTVSPDEWMGQNSNEDQEITLDQVPTTEESIRPVLDTLVLVPEEEIFYEVFRGVCRLTSLNIPEVATIKIST
jgi:hypothetical protein